MFNRWILNCPQASRELQAKKRGPQRRRSASPRGRQPRTARGCHRPAKRGAKRPTRSDEEAKKVLQRGREPH